MIFIIAFLVMARKDSKYNIYCLSESDIIYFYSKNIKMEIFLKQINKMLLKLLGQKISFYPQNVTSRKKTILKIHYIIPAEEDK